MRTPTALVQLQAHITIAAKPHPKSACLLQRSLGGRCDASHAVPPCLALVISYTRLSPLRSPSHRRRLVFQFSAIESASTGRLERAPRLLAWDVITWAYKLEGIGDPSGACHLGLVLLDDPGDLLIEHLAVVGFGGGVTVGIGLVVVANLGQLTRVEEDAFALRALIDDDVALHAPEMTHHHDLWIARASVPPAPIDLDRGALLDAQQRLAGRLARLVNLAKRPFVEPECSATALAGLNLHVARRYLCHRGAAGRTIHRVFLVSMCGE